MGDIRYMAGVHKAVWMDQSSHPPFPQHKVMVKASTGRSYETTEYGQRHIDQIKDMAVKGRLYFKTVEEAQAAVRWGSAAFEIKENGELKCVGSHYDSSG